MERGIYGIGGILSVSKELRVLWSEPYLSRLWCVFELAAFRKANPGGKITLAPLFVEGAVACIWILFTVTSFIYLFLVALRCHIICQSSPSSSHSSSHSLSHSISQGLTFDDLTESLLPALPVLVAAHFLRGHYVAKHKLSSDLEHFDLGSVQCSSDFDRKFIYEAISTWYGSVANFTDFVQDDLREELVTPILSSSMPLAYYLVLVTPSLSVYLEIFLALWKGGAPSDVMISHVLAFLLGYCLCWCPAYLALFIFLCDRLSVDRDRLQSFAIGMIVLILSDAGNIAARYCFEQGLYHSLIWAVFALDDGDVLVFTEEEIFPCRDLQRFQDHMGGKVLAGHIIGFPDLIENLTINMGTLKIDWRSLTSSGPEIRARVWETMRWSRFGSDTALNQSLA
ncbi:unnamed protein product, partial [Cladocopium goreaui]